MLLMHASKLGPYCPTKTKEVMIKILKMHFFCQHTLKIRDFAAGKKNLEKVEEIGTKGCFPSACTHPHTLTQVLASEKLRQKEALTVNDI